MYSRKTEAKLCLILLIICVTLEKNFLLLKLIWLTPFSQFSKTHGYRKLSWNAASVLAAMAEGEGALASNEGKKVFTSKHL